MPVPTAGEAVRAFEREILAYGRDAARIFGAVEAYPKDPLLAAYAALAHLFRSTRDGLALAAPYVAHARSPIADLRLRDRLLIQAISSWYEEDQPRARHTLSELLLHYADDLFAAKLLQLLQFNTGDADGMLRTSDLVLTRHSDSAIAHGMRAFALDQCGRAQEAERAARHALSLGADPWAHHAIAHAFEQTGRHAEGRDWMFTHADAWANCSSFLYTHNWWHAALFCLALGDHDAALALYDEHVWAVRKDYCQDQVNAISLLARLELAGVDVGGRWQEVARFVGPRRCDAIDGFLDLHYAFALARAGDGGAVADLERCAREGDASGWRRIMPTAIGGLVAFARGHDRRAAALLALVIPSLRLLGGSTVQRDLFTRILFAAQTGRSQRRLAA